MAGPDPITIRGLRDFQAALREMDGQSQKKLRLALNAAADLVAQRAQRKVPRKSGTAKGSVKAISSQREARVQGGGNRAPYYPWLDFGGEGRRPGRPPARRFIKEGRFIYPAFSAEFDEVMAELENQLVDLARDAGLEVTGG